MKDRLAMKERKKICPLHRTEQDTMTIRIPCSNLFDNRNAPLWPGICHRCQVLNLCDMR